MLNTIFWLLIAVVILLAATIVATIFIIIKILKVMPALADIQAQNAALIAAVTAEDTVIGSAETLIAGFGTIITGLQTQLAAALANGNDPVAVQAVVDSMGNTITDINAQKTALAASVAAGTPAAPAQAGS